MPSKESLPPSFVKLINKIHKDVSLLSFSLGRREEEREEQQTSDNIQLVFKMQIFFAFTPGGKCEAFHSKKKKKKQVN